MLEDNLLQGGSWEAGARAWAGSREPGAWAGREAGQREWRGEPGRGIWAGREAGLRECRGKPGRGKPCRRGRKAGDKGWSQAKAKTVGTEKQGLATL